MSNNTLVYIDASVLVYGLLPASSSRQKGVQKAREFFLDIERGKYQGIISTLTEIEYLGCAKRAITRSRNRQITPKEEQVVKDDLGNFLNNLGIGLSDSDLLITDAKRNPTLFSSTFSVMNTSRPYFDCQAQKEHRWKNIGGTDALMVILATRLNAQFIATFDRGLMSIDSSQIKPLIISDAY